MAETHLRRSETETKERGEGKNWKIVRREQRKRRAVQRIFTSAAQLQITPMNIFFSFSSVMLVPIGLVVFVWRISSRDLTRVVTVEDEV